MIARVLLFVGTAVLAVFLYFSLGNDAASTPAENRLPELPAGNPEGRAQWDQARLAEFMDPDRGLERFLANAKNIIELAGGGDTFAAGWCSFLSWRCGLVVLVFGEQVHGPAFIGKSIEQAIANNAKTSSDNLEELDEFEFSA